MFLFELGSAIVVGLGIPAKQDAWLAILIGMTGGIPLFLVYHYLFRQFPDIPLTSYITKILGKFIGLPLALIYVLYFLYIAARVLRDFGALLITSTLTETPIVVVNGLMMLLIAYGVFKGIEVIGRTSETAFLIMILLGMMGLSVTLFSGLIKLERIFPMLEHGFEPVLLTAIKQTYTFPFGEMIAFTMVLPYLSQPNLSKKIGVFSMFSSGLVLSLTILVEIAVLGFQGVSQAQFPLLETISLVNIGDFIQRLDIIVVFTLIFGVYIKITVFFYAGVSGMINIFGISKTNYKVISIVLLGAAVLFSSIYMTSNYIEHIYNGLKWVPIYLHWPLQTVVPLILFIVTITRKAFNK